MDDLRLRRRHSGAARMTPEINDCIDELRAAAATHQDCAPVDAAESALRAAIERALQPPPGMVLVPREFVDFVKNAPVGSGVCCCGDDMEKHASPYMCGHTPVDQWSHSLGLWLEQIAAAEQTAQEGR